MIRGTRTLEYRRRLGQAFFEDGRVMVEGLKDAVSQLQNSNQPAGLLNQAFRHAHSLKSEASFLGLTELFEQAHALEEYLALARRGDVERVGGIRTLVDAVKGVQRAFVDAEQALREQAAVLDLEAHRSTLSGTVITGPRPGGLQRLTRFERRVLREAAERGESLYRVRGEIIEPEPMLYARIYLVICNLERVVNVVKTNPPIEEVTDALRGFEILCTAEIDPDTIADSISIAAIENVRVEHRSYEHFFAAADSEDDGYRSGFLAGLREVDVSMSTRKYERLCLYTDELQRELAGLYRAVQQDKRLPDTVLQRKLAAASRMVRVVERTVTETSKVYLYGVFDELQSVVAHLGRELGKPIRLKTSGGELTAFLPLARILAETLAHLVRNAVDHGIERPEERTAAGKPEYGEIRVNAELRDHRTVIRVADDGRGIDEQAVRERYRTIFGSAPPQDLFEIVTAPGFTTRADSTVVSGRGVGLDTVRHTLETVLGAQVRMESRAGRGVTFSLSLSGGARLVSVLVARFGAERFAVPASEILETVRLDSRYLSHDHLGGSYYRFNGRDLPLLSVTPVGAVEELDAGRLFGVVTQLSDRPVVILADELVSEETVVRDEERHNFVHSQTLGIAVRLLVPLQLRV